MCVDRDEEAEEEEGNEEEENGIRSILQPLKYQLLLRAEEEDSGGGEGGVFRVKASSCMYGSCLRMLSTHIES